MPLLSDQAREAALATLPLWQWDADARAIRRVFVFAGDRIVQNRPGQPHAFEDASVNSLPELYNPATNTWQSSASSSLAPLPQARPRPRVARLPGDALLDQDGAATHVLIFEVGDEVMEGLAGFAREQQLEAGDAVSARYLVMAVGILNLMKIPDIHGMELFEGTSFHVAIRRHDDVPKDSPFQTVQELIAHAKAKPGDLNYSTGGPGSVASRRASSTWVTPDSASTGPSRGGGGRPRGASSPSPCRG